MYSTIKEFLDDWKNESASTEKVFQRLTDASLRQKVTAEGRSLGFLAWHIVLTIGEMGGKAGLTISFPGEDAPVPANARTIAEDYLRASNSLETEVRTKWTDAMLTDEIDMYGQKWTRRGTVAALVRHQIHHRAQMTILMRQAGLTVPGIYGPSHEEWSKMGMKSPQ